MQTVEINRDELVTLRCKARHWDHIKQDITWVAVWCVLGIVIAAVFAAALHWHWLSCAAVGLVAAALTAAWQVFVDEDVKEVL